MLLATRQAATTRYCHLISEQREDRLTETLSLQVIAMIGRTWTRQRYFGTIRILFPKICFGSSLFLLLTLIYYCTMPKIRQTLHGYSMICFLFSMLIVQLDIGVYFTLSNSTCVCAIIRKLQSSLEVNHLWTNRLNSVPQNFFPLRINCLDNCHGIHHVDRAQ